MRKRLVIFIIMIVCRIVLYAKESPPRANLSPKGRFRIEKVSDAVVIGRYRLYKGSYVEQEHYLIWNGMRIPFLCRAVHNLSMARRYEEFKSFLDNRDSFVDDFLKDYMEWNFSKNLFCSRFERHNMEGQQSVRSSAWYSKGESRRNIYVAYRLKGEVVVYDMDKRIELQKKYREKPLYYFKGFRHKKFAILKTAESLTPLSPTEERTLRIRRNGIVEVSVFYPE